MLRRKEDMKEWQKESLPKEEKIVGKKAPDTLPIADPPEIPEGFVPEVAPKEEKPVRKTKKKTTK